MSEVVLILEFLNACDEFQPSTEAPHSGQYTYCFAGIGLLTITAKRKAGSHLYELFYEVANNGIVEKSGKIRSHKHLQKIHSYEWECFEEKCELYLDIQSDL